VHLFGGAVRRNVHDAAAHARSVASDVGDLVDLSSFCTTALSHEEVLSCILQLSSHVFCRGRQGRRSVVHLLKAIEENSQPSRQIFVVSPENAKSRADLVTNGAGVN
jgi:hypothetical protein